MVAIIYMLSRSRSEDRRRGGVEARASVVPKEAVAGAKEFTITKSEILTSPAKPDHSILALVRVDEDDGTDVRYLRKPFRGTEEIYFDMTSANYDWDELFERGATPE